MLTKDLNPVLDIKSLKDTGEIEGYGATFGGEPDSYGDVISKGAFSDTIKSARKIKMFWQHNPSEPIGRWESAKEDDNGLLLKGRLNMDVQRGREAHALLKAGDIDGLSIGYRTVKSTYDETTEIHTLEKIDLFEVSIASIPANPSATVVAVKNERDAHKIIEQWKAAGQPTIREFENMLKWSFGFSNSEAERAARNLFNGQGEPAKAANSGADFLRALISK